jgi:membrane protease YdiL (CAAX protease family)
MSIKTKGICVFLLIAFGWIWIVWLFLSRMGLTGSPLFQLAIIPGTFAPALATFVVRKWITREGFSDAGLKLNLKKKWHYYLFALLFPFLIVLIIVILSIILGIAQLNSILQNISVLPILGLTRLASYNFADWLSLSVVLLCFAVIGTFIYWGEEFGWRGYLQIRLLSDKPQLAAVVTGIIWGVWHYPFLLETQPFHERPVLSILILCASTILISIIFGWLKYRTDSIWTVSLAHSAVNIIGGSLTESIFRGVADPILVGYLGILGWIPMGALCAWIIIGDKLKLRSRLRT